MKTIVGDINILGGSFTIGEKVSLGYFAQNQAEKLDTNLSVLENFMLENDSSENEARKILGSFLFSGDDIYKKTDVLSGGEKNRLGLSIIFSGNYNFLILDEPTNHLDIQSIEALKKL